MPSEKEIKAQIRKERPKSSEEALQIYEEENSYKFFLSGAIYNILRNTDYEKYRKVQKKAHWGLINMLSLGIDEGLAKLPTGAGKTIYFTEVISALLYAAIVNVNTVDLVGQTARQIHETTQDLDSIFTFPMHHYDEERDKFIASKKKLSSAENLKYIIKTIKEKNIRSPRILSTYASMKSLLKRNPKLLQELIELLRTLVSDEAHNTTGVIGTILNELFMDREHDNPNAKVHILATATPDRRNVSLRNKHHVMVDIKMQECFEDGTLIFPTFKGAGNAYLPARDNIPVKRKISNVELETSGKFVDENGRPIREVLIDNYIEEKKKFPYLPGVVYAGSIKESKDVHRYCTHKKLRTIVSTSADPVELAHLEDLVYEDKVDLIITVRKIAEGTDIRPLRVSIWLNASNDPVYKTQGNGRIYRKMSERDVKRIMNNLRKYSRYDKYNDDDLAKMVRKSTENTQIHEPNKWIIKKGMGPFMMEDRRIDDEPGHFYKVPPTMADELPNSMEDMLLSDEIDQSFLRQNAAEASVNLKSIIDLFAKQNIHSIQDLLKAHGQILRNEGIFMEGSRYQRIMQILHPEGLSDINRTADFFGFPHVTEGEVDEVYAEVLQKNVEGKNILELQELHRNPTKDHHLTEPIWYVKHQQNIRYRDFMSSMKLLGKDVALEIKNLLKDKNVVELAENISEYREKLFDIINEIRWEKNLRLFSPNARDDGFLNYLCELIGIPTMKQTIYILLEKYDVKTPEQTFFLDRSNPAFIRFFSNKKVLKLIGVEGPFNGPYGTLSIMPDFRSTRYFGKTLVKYLFGEAAEKEERLRFFASYIKKRYRGDMFDMADYIRSSRVRSNAIKFATGYVKEELHDHPDIIKKLVLYIYGEKNLDMNLLDENIQIVSALIWSSHLPKELESKLKKRRNKPKEYYFEETYGHWVLFEHAHKVDLLTHKAMKQYSRSKDYTEKLVRKHRQL